MTTLKQTYQNVFRLYEEENGNQAATAREVAAWGVQRGLLRTRPVDPVALLAQELSEALSDERGSDGHRKNLARRAKVNGRQTRLWGATKDQTKEFVEAAVQDWRRQMAGECVIVDRTLEYRHKERPDDGDKIQFSFDFAPDVAEAVDLDDEDDDDDDDEGGSEETG